MGYKYRLVKENEWRFELLPNNNNNQPVGKSCNYKTKQDAWEGMQKLKMFLVNMNIERIHYDVEQEMFGNKINYYGSFLFSKEEKFYTTKYEQHNQVAKGINRIVQHGNAEYRSQLNKIQKGEDIL